MFLQVCVVLFMGGGMHVWLPGGGTCVVAGGACVVAPRGVVCYGGHAWLLWRACMVAAGGACMVAMGACMVAPRGHVCFLWGGKELGYMGEAEEVTVPISSIVHSLEGGAPSQLL